MSGEDATITIKTRTLVGGPMTEKWSMSGDQGLLWNRGSLPLNSGDTFQVRKKDQYTGTRFTKPFFNDK